MEFIGIDLGASFIKGCILNVDSLTIYDIVKLKSPFPLENKLLTRIEYDPSEYEKKVMQIINKLSKNRKIAGIIFSTQMHGMILVDKKLKPLTNFISWQDERVFEKNKNKGTAIELIGKKTKKLDISETGIKLRSGIMGVTLFWLGKNNFFKKHTPSKALFLGDYIAARISDGKTLVHPTNASGSGLFSVKENKWDEKIIKMLRIPKSVLPEITNNVNTIIGTISLNSRFVPVYVSVGDMQAAILGSYVGLSSKKEFCINIGTGSQVSTISNSFTISDYDIRSYFDNKYLFTFTHIPAGRALNVIINFLENIGRDIFSKKIDVWEKLISYTNKISATQGLAVDISFFKNNVMNRSSGYIMNITESNLKIENIFYEALRNMVENYHFFYKRLGGRKDDVIIVAGGLGRKVPKILDLLKENISSHIILSSNSEETLSGLMIISVYLAHKYESIEKASRFCKRKKIKIVL